MGVNIEVWESDTDSVDIEAWDNAGNNESENKVSEESDLEETECVTLNSDGEEVVGWISSIVKSVKPNSEEIVMQDFDRNSDGEEVVGWISSLVKSVDDNPSSEETVMQDFDQYVESITKTELDQAYSLEEAKNLDEFCKSLLTGDSITQDLLNTTSLREQSIGQRVNAEISAVHTETESTLLNRPLICCTDKSLFGTESFRGEPTVQACTANFENITFELGHIPNLITDDEIQKAYWGISELIQSDGEIEGEITRTGSDEKGKNYGSEDCINDKLDKVRKRYLTDKRLLDRATELAKMSSVKLILKEALNKITITAQSNTSAKVSGRGFRNDDSNPYAKPRLPMLRRIMKTPADTCTNRRNGQCFTQLGPKFIRGLAATKRKNEKLASMFPTYTNKTRTEEISTLVSVSEHIELNEYPVSAADLETQGFDWIPSPDHIYCKNWTEGSPLNIFSAVTQELVLNDDMVYLQMPSSFQSEFDFPKPSFKISDRKGIDYWDSADSESESSDGGQSVSSVRVKKILSKRILKVELLSDICNENDEDDNVSISSSSVRHILSENLFDIDLLSDLDSDNEVEMCTNSTPSGTFNSEAEDSSSDFFYDVVGTNIEISHDGKTTTEVDERKLEMLRLDAAAEKAWGPVPMDIEPNLNEFIDKPEPLSDKCDSITREIEETNKTRVCSTMGISEDEYENLANKYSIQLGRHPDTILRIKTIGGKDMVLSTSPSMEFCKKEMCNTLHFFHEMGYMTEQILNKPRYRVEIPSFNLKGKIDIGPSTSKAAHRRGELMFRISIYQRDIGEDQEHLDNPRIIPRWMEPHCQFEFIETQLLVDLRMCLQCLKDCITTVPYESTTSAYLNFADLAYSTNPAWYMLVENTVFYDGRFPSSLELAKRYIHSHATSFFLEKKKLILKDASKTRFIDLEIRFGYPYRLVHQIGCMHTIVFHQARLAEFDELNTQFPRHSDVYLTPRKEIMCEFHKTPPPRAEWVITHSKYMEDRDYMFICKSCADDFVKLENISKEEESKIQETETPKECHRPEEQLKRSQIPGCSQPSPSHILVSEPVKSDTIRIQQPNITQSTEESKQNENTIGSGLITIHNLNGKERDKAEIPGKCQLILRYRFSNSQPRLNEWKWKRVVKHPPFQLFRFLQPLCLFREILKNQVPQNPRSIAKWKKDRLSAMRLRQGFIEQIRNRKLVKSKPK